MVAPKGAPRRISEGVDTEACVRGQRQKTQPRQKPKMGNGKNQPKRIHQERKKLGDGGRVAHGIKPSRLRGTRIKESDRRGNIIPHAASLIQGGYSLSMEWPKLGNCMNGTDRNQKHHGSGRQDGLGLQRTVNWGGRVKGRPRRTF